MDKTYSSRDIILMVMQAKERGVQLYLALARDSENYHVSQLFAELAKDENRHKIMLHKWLDSLNKDVAEEAYPGEKALYLKALVDESTFNCDDAEKKLLNKTISEDEAIQTGISFEKDFMLFLHELKQKAEDTASETIKELLEDEVRHLKEMFFLREKMKEK